MTLEEKNKRLLYAFEDVVWMAIRYAHGRQTYAPGLVRDAVNDVREMFPDWELPDDPVIFAPEKVTGLPSDYLHDLYETYREDK